MSCVSSNPDQTSGMPGMHQCVQSLAPEGVGAWYVCAHHASSLSIAVWSTLPPTERM